MGVVVINGFDGVDDNISSGSLGSGDTLMSSTYGGDDRVSVFSSHYDVRLGAGNDVLQGGIGGQVFGEAGNDRLTAFLWEGVHLHDGGAGDDRLEVFYGGDGASYTGRGGAGQDQFRDFSTGNAPSTMIFDGGSGYDVVSHSGTLAIRLVLGGTGTQGASSKSYVNIEGAMGAAGDDKLTGNGQNNLLVGGNGADSLLGQGGDDFLVGDAREQSFVTAWLGINPSFDPAAAFDPLGGVAGAYASDGGGMNDTLRGGAGNDVLLGGDGADLLDGGLGTDWASYASQAVGGVVLSLATGGTAGHAAGDLYVGIENVQGSAGHDTIGGDQKDNALWGMGGDDSLEGLVGSDTLAGGDGRDTLAGGAGADQLTGGAAEDVFVFAGPGVLAAVDQITDLQVGFDEIWLSAAVFRKLGAAGVELAASSFAIGAAAQDGKDRIIYDAATGALWYDADGNKPGAAVQFAQLQAGLALTSGDFMVVA